MIVHILLLLIPCFIKESVKANYVASWAITGSIRKVADTMTVNENDAFFFLHHKTRPIASRSQLHKLWDVFLYLSVCFSVVLQRVFDNNL